MNLSNAIALASELFRDVKDRGGEPYILHCLHVMNQFSDPELKIIGVLHDIIEDTDFELDTLESFGYSTRVYKHLIYSLISQGCHMKIILYASAIMKML